MTHDDDLDQPELRELLEERARVSDFEVEPLRRFAAQLPPRRRSWGRGILAAAAGIVVVLAGLGALAILTVPWGSSGAAPQPPNPSYFVGDPRLAVCNAKAADAIAIFELQHLSDYAAQLPNAYPLIGLQADPSDRALVIVFKGPGSAERLQTGGSTQTADTHDLCLVIGADAAHWQQVGVGAVDTTGLQAFKPEPTGTPIAADLLPWVNACGGVEAGINRVLQLPHGTDAMTLNSVQVPISTMTADPMTIVVYDGAHPFAPLGTPPAPGATVAPREPGYQDLCILVGSDPATAKRTIVETGPTGEITDAPSGGPGESSTSLPTSDVSPGPSTAPDAPSGSIPPASPSSNLQPQISAADCASLKFSERRCLAVVEQARKSAGVDWAGITSVNLAEPQSNVALGGMTVRVAEVTFTMVDGSTASATAGCSAFLAQYDAVCTDHPQIRLATPFGGGYHDVPCGSVPAGEPGASCATPLPTINANAPTVPLRIGSQDYPLAVGHQEILVGQATLPNGILSEARFSLADPTTQAFGVDGAVTLVVRSTDPSRPAFDNAFTHGWYPGSEVVNVYLVLDVVSVTPGATLQVRDLVVR